MVLLGWSAVIAYFVSPVPSRFVQCGAARAYHNNPAFLATGAIAAGWFVIAAAIALRRGTPSVQRVDVG